MKTSYIKNIALFKFGRLKGKDVEDYIKNFDPNNPECRADEMAYLQNELKDQETLDRERQNYRTENYFITNLLYDFHSGSLVQYFDFTNGWFKDDDKIRLDAQILHWVRSCFLNKAAKIDENIPYGIAVHRFSEKYNVHLDPEQVAKTIKEIAGCPDSKDMYRQYYKTMFAYSVLKYGNQENVDEVIEDFENIMRGIRHDVTGRDNIPMMEDRDFAYGGLTSQQLTDYLLEFDNVNQNRQQNFEQNIDNDVNDRGINIENRRRRITLFSNRVINEARLGQANRFNSFQIDPRRERIEIADDELINIGGENAALIDNRERNEINTFGLDDMEIRNDNDPFDLIHNDVEEPEIQNNDIGLGIGRDAPNNDQ